MSKGTLSNQLLGRVVRRNDELPHFKQRTPDGIEAGHVCERCNKDAFTRSCWPFDNEPNATGQFLATIEAAWIEDGAVKLALRSVMTGRMADAWLSHVILTEKN